MRNDYGKSTVHPTKWFIFTFIFLPLTTFLLTACSAAPKDDAQFLKNLKLGLQDRWKYSDKETQYTSDKEQRASYQVSIDSETKRLGELESYTFEDKALENLAKQYYEALANQNESLQYFGTSDIDFKRLYSQNGYYLRAKVIFQLNKDFGLTVDEDYQDTLTEFCVAGKNLLDIESVLASLSETITSDFVLEFSGNKQYELVAHNSSEFDLANVSVTVTGYEDDVTTTTSTGYLQTWKSGDKNKLDIYLDKNFDKATVSISFNDNSGFGGQTEPLEVEVKNDLIINVEMPKLPMEVSAAYGDRAPYVKCIVEQIEFEENYWNEGKATGILKFSGKKTYDEDGDSYSRDCRIGWKLYDSDDNVIASGTCSTSNVETDESFKLDKSYINAEMAPGNYRLEILNVT